METVTGYYTSQSMLPLSLSVSPASRATASASTLPAEILNFGDLKAKNLIFAKFFQRQPSPSASLQANSGRKTIGYQQFDKTEPKQKTPTLASRRFYGESRKRRYPFAAAHTLEQLQG